LRYKEGFEIISMKLNFPKNILKRRYFIQVLDTTNSISKLFGLVYLEFSENLVNWIEVLFIDIL